MANKQFSQMSNEELMQIAGIQHPQAQPAQNDIRTLSDDQLFQMAGIQRPNIEGQNPNQLIQGAMAGPAGLMPKLEDVPGLMSKYANGLSGGQIQANLEFPMGGGQFGVGANMPNRLSNLLSMVTGGKTPVAPEAVQTSGLEALMPQPVTPGGQVAGTLLELGGGAMLPQAGQGASNMFSKAANTSSIKNVKNPVQFAQKVRNEMFGLRSKLGKELDASITDLSKANPTKRIDLSGPMQQLKEALADPNNPGLSSDIRRTISKIKDPEIVAALQRFIKNPRFAENLTLRTAEDMKRAISQAPSIATKMGNRFANWTPGDHELLDLLDEIKSTQAEQFPELSQVRAPYAEYMQNYRQVKNLFKPQSLLGKIKTKFGNEEIEQMVEKVLPPQMIKEIGGVRKLANLKRALVAALKPLGVTATVAGGVAAGRKLTGN